MLAVLVALILAQEVVPTAPSEKLPPPPPPAPTVTAPAAQIPAPAPPGDVSTAPPLPDGPLMPVARSERGETFLVLDRSDKTGDTVDFWTYEAFVPAVPLRLGAEAVQGLAHHQINCAAHTDQTVASAGYDESGTAIVALAAGPAAPLEAGSPYALVADVLCKGRPLPKSGAVQGHAAALSSARQPAAS